jgi:hypothetical protein
MIKNSYKHINYFILYHKILQYKNMPHKNQLNIIKNMKK